MSEPLAGRYRLAGELGRGGMGTVWRAYDETLNRDVAVKELTLTASAERRERAVRRALREARAAARLRHPGIVTVHDVVVADGRPWIVMELLSGRSLHEVVRQDGPLDPARAAAIGVELLDALSAAHAHGILHRDVKPANVFLRDDGRAVLTDFGIASMAGDTPLTRPGALIGSPAYMAPERIRGEPGGPPSDLWSLGATLYALVEGRTPFDRATPLGMLGAVLADAPIPPHRAGPLTGPLLHLLTKDPAARPDAEQTRRELAAIAGPAASAPGAAGRRPVRAAAIAGPAASARGATGRRPVRIPAIAGRVASAQGAAERRPVRTAAIALTAAVCLVAAAVTVFSLGLGGRKGGGPVPIGTVPPMCGMISVTLMNRLVPHAGPGPQDPADPLGFSDRYFQAIAHPGTEACVWYQENKVLDRHSAEVVTRPVAAGPSDDPMRPARADFARLRRADTAAPGVPGDPHSTPRPMPGVGDEAYVYDYAAGEANLYREFDAIVVLRTRNLVSRVRYRWFNHGAPPPGGIPRLRQGALRIAHWTDAALRTGRPATGP